MSCALLTFNTVLLNFAANVVQDDDVMVTLTHKLHHCLIILVILYH